MDHLGKLDSMENLVPRGILGTKVLEVHQEHGVHQEAEVNMEFRGHPVLQAIPDFRGEQCMKR